MVGRGVGYNTAGSMSLADEGHWLDKESYVDMVCLQWPVARWETARPMDGSWRSVSADTGR